MGRGKHSAPEDVQAQLLNQEKVKQSEPSEPFETLGPDDAVRLQKRPSRLKKKGKKSGKKNGNILPNLLIAIGFVLLGVAVYMWGSAQWNYHQQGKVNEELSAYVTVYDDGQTTDEDAGPKPPEVDWEGLKALNPDVVAWLQMPGTEVNYPVYQAEDNERYLRNSATGEWTVGGQLFNDFECTRPGMVDQVTLTYGHHLLDGTMFMQVAEMDDQTTFDAVDKVWYVTEEKAWLLEPLLLFYTHGDDESVRTFNWENEEKFHERLNELLAQAVTKREDAGELIGKTKHVLALITCNYYEGYGRTILLCVPKEEVE